jgi:hypothetical protein
MTAECDAVAADLPELALGILTGRHRAEVLAHLEGCPRCRAEVGQLSQAADALLALPPEAEPPVGFESRVFDRLGVRLRAGREAPVRPGRPARVRILVGSAVAAALLLLGFGLGWLAGPGSPPAPTAARDVSAQLTAAGGSRGQATLSGTRPRWIVMTVSDLGRTGTVECQLVLSGGGTVAVGRFHLTDGTGAWAAPLPAGTASVTAARLVTPTGRVLAAGSFSGGWGSGPAE